MIITKWPGSRPYGFFNSGVTVADRKAAGNLPLEENRLHKTNCNEGVNRTGVMWENVPSNNDSKL